MTYAPSEAGSTVFTFLESVDDLTSRADTLRTEAATASRIVMEDLVPRIESLLEEFAEEEKRLTEKPKKRGFGNPFRRTSRRTFFGRKTTTMMDNTSMKSLSDQNLGSRQTRGRRPIRSDGESVPSPTFIPQRGSSIQRTYKRLQFPSSAHERGSKISRTGSNLSRSGKKMSRKKQLMLLRTKKKELEEDLAEIRVKAGPELREEENGSVCGVFNEDTGKVEWRISKASGIYGVWNPILKKIEWRTKMAYSLYGVFNPKKRKVEWGETHRGAVCGVFNPITEKVEWQKYKTAGVYGVWNPLREKVEWKRSKVGGIIGWFDSDQEKVIWLERESHGICRVVKNNEKTGYLTQCCNFIPGYY